MTRILWLMVVVLGIAHPICADEAKPKPLVNDLKHPSAVCAGPDGRIYVAVGSDKLFDGYAILVVRDNKAVPFTRIPGSVQSMAWYQKWLFVVDQTKIWKVDPQGKAEVFVSASSVLQPKHYFCMIAIDPESGALYVSDWDESGQKGQIYRIDPKGKVSPITKPGELEPCALILDGASHLLVGEWGPLKRVRLADGKSEQVAKVGEQVSAMAWDMHGRLFISDGPSAKLFVIPQPGMAPAPLPGKFSNPSAICLDPTRMSILVADSAAGTITAVPAQVPGQPVDESPLPLETAVAFPDLKWTGWQGETDAGKIHPLRPIVLTHGGDGSNRVFVAIQQGTIHVFPNDQKVKETKVFLDIQDKVRYVDKENEEGFLGLAFHPDYKKTGEFFVFYTPKNQKLVNVVSRFRVSKDDPNKADPASEEIIFSVKRPFWNHDGGTICFGPDGYLYIALGDGGAANDPFNNGQNLKQPLAKILRIDVNKKDHGKNYAVPPDNPFANGRAEERKLPGALPETWAYGLRNVWRMSFDRKTGKLWAGDVGQNLYEEINIIEKGGNYGWRLREGLHPFGSGGVGPRSDLIDPIWEYHHDVGKSITGGHVYRGKLLPELEGHYLCADYVTGKIWVLMYGEKEKRVTAWRPIRDKALPIMSFGEDEKGEVYLMTYAASGRGIYRFVRTNAGPSR